MKTTINFNQFSDSFSGGYKDNFSYEGKKALFERLEEYEQETGEEIELDPIALCCEFTEYENLEELQGNYTDIKNMEDLQNYTQVIEIKGTDKFIIQDY